MVHPSTIELTEGNEVYSRRLRLDGSLLGLYGLSNSCRSVLDRGVTNVGVNMVYLGLD